MSKKIIQIIPAVGWYAKYDLGEGGEKEFPLVCWVHCQDQEYVSVEGMDIGAGRVEFCEEDKSFVGYVYKGVSV